MSCLPILSRRKSIPGSTAAGTSAGARAHLPMPIQKSVKILKIKRIREIIRCNSGILWQSAICLTLFDFDFY